jgi:hypothetical protein
MYIKQGDSPAVSETDSGLREVVLAALNEFRCPCALEELQAYLGVFEETTLSPDDMETLLEHEQRRFLDGASGAILCPVILRMPGFPAYPGLLSRSDWDLAERVVLPSSEAKRQLWLLRRLCDFAIIALEERQETALLVQQVDRRRRFILPAGILEARLQLGLDDRPEGTSMTEALILRERLAVCREVAEDAFLLLDDAAVRQQATEELTQMPIAVRLFGGELHADTY